MLKTKLIKLLTCFVPQKSVRQKIRKKFSFWWNFSLKDNSFVIVSTNGEKFKLNKIKKIDGLNIHINGKNNTVIIHKPTNFVDSELVIKGNNNIVEIGYANPKIKSLKIYLDRNENNRLLKIGDGFSIQSGKLLLKGENQQLIIGDNCMLSNNVMIRTSDSHVIRDLNTNERINPDESVFIGDNVWITQNVHVLKGAKIPSGSIVGAESLVNKKFDKENIILAGNPAKINKENVYREGIPIPKNLLNKK